MKFIKNPFKIITYLGSKGRLKWVPSLYYLRLTHLIRHGERLDLSNPITFNEKLQWMKIYYRDSRFTELTDKYEVRKYVSDKIGDRYLIKLLGAWNNFSEIDFENLPEKFVLKCNHDSGSVVFIDKSKKNDFKKLETFFEKKLSKNHYWKSREWNYKEIKAKIIAEELLADADKTYLTDYKFFCFNGVPRIIQVDLDRFGDHRRNIYNTNWELLDVKINVDPLKEFKIEKPKQLEKMLEIAAILSEGFPHVRVDLYLVKEQIYFGEMTFFHGGGQENFQPYWFSKKMGDWIDLESISYK